MEAEVRGAEGCVGAGATVPAPRDALAARPVGGDELMVAPECTLHGIGLDRLRAIWRNGRSRLEWSCPFVLPPWLHTWLETQGRTVEPLVLAGAVRQDVVGLAPLMIRDGRVLFLGDPEVSDHFDCVVAPGWEASFFGAILDHLKSAGIRELDLGPVREDSVLFTHLPAAARTRGMAALLEREGASFEVSLPSSWDEFLMRLTGKQRHEVRRKMRRLEEAGRVGLRCVRRPGETQDALPLFLELFRMNRPDKAGFMSEAMAAFFGTLADRLAMDGLLRLFFLDLDGETVASVFCFDHQHKRYLYNNGYNERFSPLSVSLLCKVLSLQDAIVSALTAFDFLKGSETYKERLGGHEIPLYRCRVPLNGRWGFDRVSRIPDLQRWM